MGRERATPGDRGNVVVLSTLDVDGAKGGATDSSPRSRARPDFQAAWRVLEGRHASASEFVNLAFDHCHTMVYAIANRITGSRWEAEDVTQAVFEALLAQIDQIRDHARIPGFLRTCAVRMSLRHVKRSRWRRARADVAYAFDPQDFIPDEPTLAAIVHQLLARLDPEERAAVVLKCVELHSHEEVAELMGVSVATARRRLDSGRKKLAGMIGEERVGELLGAGGEP